MSDQRKNFAKPNNSDTKFHRVEHQRYAVLACARHFGLLLPV